MRVGLQQPLSDPAESSYMIYSYMIDTCHMVCYQYSNIQCENYTALLL